MGVGVTGLSLALLGAAPAQAGDEFEDGFKDELGRIAAHEAVRGGRQILASFLLGGGPQPVAAPYREPAPAYYPESYGYAPEPYGQVSYHRHDHYHHYPTPVVYYDRGGHWDGGHGWKHGHRKAHRHHRGCHH
jgi:hypothetical protein